MRDLKQAKRPLLTAGLGVAVYTALEGLACGNPIEPACPVDNPCLDARIDASNRDASDGPPVDADVDAQVDAEADAAVDAQLAKP